MAVGQGRKLSAAHLELFMAVLIQNENVFLHFSDTIDPGHFSGEHFQLLYRVLLDHYDANKSLPSYSELDAGLKSVFEEDPEIISDVAVGNLENFLSYAFDAETFSDYSPSSAKMEKYAFTVGKKILLNKLKTDITSTLSSHTSVDTDELGDFFQRCAEQSEILSQTEYSNKPQLSFEDGWDKSDPEYIYTTGFEFFDRYMAGGYKKGEIYGLMAPYGTCKTTLAVMLWCKAAEQCYAAALADPEAKKGLSFLVTYEAPLIHEIRHRALMFTAGVHRESLDRMGSMGLDALNNDADNPLPYEKYKFSKEVSHGIFKPERQRILEAIPALNQHTVCLDFTGSDPNWPRAGSQGVREIINRIKLELRNRGGEDKCYVKNVIVDYLGLLVDRDVNIKAVDSADESKVLAKHVEKLKTNLSVRFKCHTWVLHQLSGAANSIRSPTRNMWHTDSKGSKSFAENVDYSFVVGQLNLEQLGQLHCTKQRRSKRAPPAIIRVEGEYNTVYVPDNFHIDSRGQIVDKADAESTGASNDIYADIIQDNTLGNEESDEQEYDELL